MNKYIVLSLLLISIVLPSFPQTTKGYGDWLDAYPGYPIMRERRILVLTNACRIAPAEYRDAYIGNYNILLPQNYPGVHPLYWHVDLNRASRAHAIDMANNHGLNHNSSDGTAFDDRIRLYYTKSGWFGENIAAGSRETLGSMRQWIMDGNPPASDNSGQDGHRSNIMSDKYHEMGMGYAYGPQRYNYFWVQDFSTGQSDYTTPITAGAHFVGDNDSTLFMTTYTDPQNQAPQSASLVIESEVLPLSLHLGTRQNGTYTLELPSANDCRSYYFQFTDSQSKTWRHPEAGMLVTQDEGTCEEEYEDPNAIIWQPRLNNTTKNISIRRIINQEILIEVTNKRFMPKYSLLMNCKGQVLKKQIWGLRKFSADSKLLILQFQLPSSVSPGAYVLVHGYDDNRSVGMKVYLF